MAAFNNAIIADLDNALVDFDLSNTDKIIAPTPALTPARLAVVAPVPVLATPVVSPASLSELDAFYASVDEAQVAILQATATRIKEHDRAYRAGCLDIGKELITIKNSIPGHFDKWLRLEFDLSKATAWNYINAAQEFGDVPKVVEILPPATVYKLAAKATPAEVRETIVLEITAGKIPTKQDVERRIAVARDKAAVDRSALKQAEREHAEAERQQREDEEAWMARAKEFAETGKTEAEVNKERRAWDTAKAKKEREKDKRQQAKQQKEEDRKREAEEWRAERDRQRQAAHEAADFLRKRLGPDFEAFRSMMADALIYEFQSAIVSAENKEIA